MDTHPDDAAHGDPDLPPGAARPGGADVDMDDRPGLPNDEPVDDEEDVVTPASGHTGLSLLLAIAGMFLIPVGLIIVFLAFTRGDRLQDQGDQNKLTPVSENGTGFTPSLSALAGRWNIQGGPESWVGYSIGEKFLSVDSPNTAQGRTNTLDGGIVLGPAGLQAVAVNATMADLESDDAKRDETLRTRGLETDRFPNASFSASNPVALGTVPAMGQHLEVTVPGDLTIHGVTKPVELHVQVQLLPGDPAILEVVGNQTINLRDFGIDPPTIAGMTTVDDHGELRLHLRLAKVPDEVANLPPKPGTTR